MRGWREVALDSVVEKFIDYRGKTPRKTTAGIPLITAKVVKEGRILTPTEFIAIEDYDEWMRRGYPQIDDVLLTTEAPLGEVALLKDRNVALAQRIIAIRGKDNKLFNPFLKYYLQSPTGQEELDIRSSGSTVTGIKAAELKKLPIKLPPLPEQKAIAAVLSSLDDKIDLLHRQNATLEGMAEALFRQWFVVEAKDEWEEGTLGDVLQLNYGKALNERERTGFGFPVVGSSGVVGYHSESLVSAPGLVTGRKGTLGRVILLYDNFYPIDTTFYVTSRFSFFPMWYFYFLLKSLNFGEMNSDSAVPGLNRDAAHSLEILLAPEKLIKDYEDQVMPLQKKIRHNQTQIRTLEKLRDTLLPKLMSGEVRVEV